MTMIVTFQRIGCLAKVPRARIFQSLARLAAARHSRSSAGAPATIPNQKKKPPSPAAPRKSVDRWSLLDLGRDAGERIVERGAQFKDGGDDRNRNAGND